MAIRASCLTNIFDLLEVKCDVEERLGSTTPKISNVSRGLELAFIYMDTNS
jgi:hypothetical protein